MRLDDVLGESAQKSRNISDSDQDDYWAGDETEWDRIQQEKEYVDTKRGKRMSGEDKSDVVYGDVPKEVWERLGDIIEAEDLDYADNHRAYRVDDEYNKQQWQDAYDEGCCGYFDTDITLNNGEQWVVGCNYGH